jgi:hypothetical protein
MLMHESLFREIPMRHVIVVKPLAGFRLSKTATKFRVDRYSYCGGCDEEEESGVEPEPAPEVVEVDWEARVFYHEVASVEFTNGAAD